MAMLKIIAGNVQQLRGDARAARTRAEAARLRRKLVRKEIGMAVITLGAMALYVNAASGLSGLIG